MSKNGRPNNTNTAKRDRTIPLDTSRTTYRPREVAAKMGLPISTVYDGLYSGIIPGRRIGRGWVIPAAFVEGRD